MDRNRISQEYPDKKAVAERLKARAGEMGLRQAEIAQAVGIPKTTMGRIWKGENLPDAVTLFSLAAVIDRSAHWLLFGGDAAAANISGPASLTLPWFEFAAIAEAPRGEPTGTMSLDRSWFDQRLRADDRPWLTTMPNDLLEDVAAEGDLLICSDIEPGLGALADGRIYLLLLSGQPIIRRVSFEPGHLLLSTSNDRLPPIRIARHGAGQDDRAVVPIARVLGAIKLTAV